MKKINLIIFLGVIFLIIISLLWWMKLTNLSESISEIEEQKIILEEEILKRDDEQSILNSDISVANNKYNNVQQRLNNVISDINYLKNSVHYELHDPTYSEMIDFLKSDLTNEKEYVGDGENLYVCRHFSQEINNNSEKQGIRCAYIGIIFSGDEPHAILAFNTTDKGMIYYDSSYYSMYNSITEHENGYYWKINLEIGKDYYADCVTLPYGFYYPPDPDCIVVDFINYW